MITTGITIDSRIDTELLVGLIFQYCGAMTPVYNTSTTFVWANQLFFKNWYWQIGQLLDTLEYDYEPLENFRREEDLKRGTSEDTSANTTEQESNESSSNGTTSQSGNNTEETKVSAYNESLYQPQQQVTNNYSDNGSATNTANSARDLGRKRTENRTFGAKEDNLIKGLNGLFTSQNLIEQQRDVVQFNVYMWIVKKYQETMMYGVF